MNDAKKQGVLQIALEATDMGQPLYEALTKGTETLAERRMDRSIREALSGMSVDDEMFDEKPEDESKNH